MKNLFHSSLITTLAFLLIATSQSANGSEFSMPEFEKYQLDNGLTVYLMEQHEVPLISARLVINSGSLTDAKAGLSQITAQALLFGDKNTSKQDFQQAFEFVGATVRGSANYDSMSLVMKSRKQDFETLFAQFSNAALEPNFNQQDLTKLINLHKQQLVQAKDSPRAVINNYFMQSLYGPEGYGQPVAGSIDSVATIKGADLRKHHANYFVPNNAALVIVGDIDIAASKKLIKQQFSQWQAKKVKQAATMSSQPLEKNQVLLINKDDARETTFMFGGFGVKQSNPDTVSLSVINTILGGRFTSWLNDELRVNTGLTYGARSSFAQYKHTGTFAISTFTKNASTEEAIDLALKTYDKLWSQGLDKETLDSAKNYLVGLFPPKYETSSQLAALLANMYVYDFDQSYINDFKKEVNSLTVASSKTLINKYFPRKPLQFVIVGKAKEIGAVVKKYGSVSNKEIK